jgi:hypothetical protein
MRFSAVLFLAPLAAALAAEPLAGAEAGFNLTNLAEGSSFDTRAAQACDYNGCKCDTEGDRNPQGQFCGGCHWRGTKSTCKAVTARPPHS